MRSKFSWMLLAVLGVAPIAWAESNDARVESYVIVWGDSTTVHGSGHGMRAAMRLKATLGDHYIWFTSGGKAYVVRDAATVKVAHALFEPQRELGERQGQLGERQGKLGMEQAEAGQEMAAEAMASAMSALDEADDTGPKHRHHHHKRDSSSDGDDSEFDSLSAQQAELGRQQAELGSQQAKLAEAASRKMQTLLEEAQSKGLAQAAP